MALKFDEKRLESVTDEEVIQQSSPLEYHYQKQTNTSHEMNVLNHQPAETNA